MAQSVCHTQGISTSKEYTDLPQGDRIIVVVQKHRLLGEGGPGATSAASANKVRRGDIRHAIIVRTKKKYQRKDGMVVRFDDNACALIGKNGEPLGTRINGGLSCDASTLLLVC
jgi:ribosomal protein L14